MKKNSNNDNYDMKLMVHFLCVYAKSNNSKIPSLGDNVG